MSRREGQGKKGQRQEAQGSPDVSLQPFFYYGIIKDKVFVIVQGQ